MFRLTTVFLLSCWVLTAGAQQFDWAYEAGGVGLDVGRAVASDEEGNVIMVGSFSGVARFADTTLVGMGGPDAFIAKFTSEGEQLWIRSINGPAENLARSVCTDPQGNVYVTGHFTNWAYFLLTEEDTVRMVSSGGKDIFIAKYTPDGDLDWVRRAGGPQDDTGTGIIYHSHGKLVVSGGFQGRATFANVSMLSSGLTDAFVLFMEPDGNAYWVRRGGGPQHDVAASVTHDPTTGDIYITGDFFATANFDGTVLNATGSSDMFLAKYSMNGQLQWAVAHGGVNLDVATQVGCDYNGFVYVAGQYQMTTVFGPYAASSRGYNDVFVAKFNGFDGSPVWLRSMGGTDLETCQGLMVNWDGTTYTTGMFDTRMISDSDTLQGNSYDIFIACLEPSGHTRYLKSAGAGSADIPMGICAGPGESLLITGYFFFFAQFDDISIGNAINGDIFLARLTDIVGVEDMPLQEPLQCLRYDPYTRTIRLICGTDGPWQLYDLSGRLLGQGEFRGGETSIDRVSSGPALFVTVVNGQRVGLGVME
jgi:hypothetical protein